MVPSTVFIPRLFGWQHTCVTNLSPFFFLDPKHKFYFFPALVHTLQWFQSKVLICCIGINYRLRDYDRCDPVEGKDENNQMTVIKCSAVGGWALNSLFLFTEVVLHSIWRSFRGQSEPRIADSCQPVHLMSTVECVSQQSGSHDVDI